MRDDILKWRGVPIDDVSGEDLAGARHDIEAASAEMDALPPDAQARLLRRFEAICLAEEDVNRQDRAQNERTRDLAMLLRSARQQGRIEGLEHALAARPAPHVDVAHPVVHQTDAASSDRRHEPWTDAINEFLADRPGLDDKTIKSFRSTFTEWESLVGQKHLASITKADVKKYADHLRDKTSNRGGSLSRTTIIRQLGQIKTYMKWSVDNGFVDDRGFEKIQARAATADERMQRPQDVRRAFTDIEFRRLFDSPLFNGYHSPERRSRPGKRRDRPADFWFFVTAALTGARCEELALAPARLHDLGGILCLDLREAGRKTSNSPRLIPVLPELHRVGFVQWCANQEKRGRLLMQPPEGPRSAQPWSKRLNRYLDDVGLDDPALVFYSLRHGFRQMLRASGLNIEIINKIFGHEGDAVGDGYGRDLSVGEARLFIESVQPPGLEHLWTTTRLR